MKILVLTFLKRSNLRPFQVLRGLRENINRRIEKEREREREKGRKR